MSLLVDMTSDCPILAEPVVKDCGGGDEACSIGPSYDEEAISIIASVTYDAMVTPVALIRVQTENESLVNDVSVAEQRAVFFDDSFTCPIPGCSKVFFKSNNYRRHRKRFHKLPCFNCFVCSKPFESAASLADHMSLESHFIKCTQCPLTFSRLSSAANHYNLRHKPFKCFRCQEYIVGRSSYQRHLKFIHDAEDNFNVALSMVETYLNSSFSELPTSSEVTPLPQDDRDVIENNTAIIATAPLAVSDEANALPDSTTSNEFPDSVNTLVNELGRSSPKTNSEGTCQETSSELMCSDMYAACTKTICDVNTAPSPCVGESPFELIGSNKYHTSSFYDGHQLLDPLEAQDPCSVLFGPGAEELLNNYSVLNDLNQDSSNEISKDQSQWIGHNVEMFHKSSEDHRRIYRFVCRKCSHSFKSKAMLQNHAKSHEFLCQHCFLRFDNLIDYKSHLKIHILKKKHFACSVCSHVLLNLKKLMVHEMWHRLNLQFSRSIESTVENKKDSERDAVVYECKVCNKNMGDLSKLLRHEVWHQWPSMWKTYVVGRTFKGVFSEKDGNKYKKIVQRELRWTWRDCERRHSKSGNKVSAGSKRYLPPESNSDDELSDTIESCNNHAKAVTYNSDDNANQLLTSSDGASRTESQTEYETDDDASRTESKTESETDDDASRTESETEYETDSLSPVVNGWMSYWYSYVGLRDNEAPPSWMKPLLTKLRSEWRNYDAQEHERLYRQMDQIAIILRAQRNESHAADEPRVILRRLPKATIMRKASSAYAISSPSYAPEFLLSTPLKKVTVLVEKLPDDHVNSSKLSNRSLFMKRESKSSKFSCDKDLFVNRRVGIDVKNQYHNYKLQPLSVSIERCDSGKISMPCYPFTSQTLVDCTPVTSKVSRCTRQQVSASLSVKSSLLSPMVKSTKEDTRTVKVSPSVKACGIVLEHPIVVLPRISRPTSETEEKGDWSKDKLNIIENCHDIKKKRNVWDGSAHFTLEDLFSWIKQEIGHCPIPRWALPLIEHIWRNPSPKAERRIKMRRLLNLIKAELKERKRAGSSR